MRDALAGDQVLVELLPIVTISARINGKRCEPTVELDADADAIRPMLGLPLVGRLRNALPWTPSAQLYINGSGGLPRQRSRRQFPHTYRAETLQEFLVVAKRSRPSAPANSSKSFRSLSLTTSPRLSASKKPVDFRLADWLLERNAGKHFECGGRETRNPVRFVLFAQIVGQGLIVDFGSEKRNYSVDNSQLKAHKGELTVA